MTGDHLMVRPRPAGLLRTGQDGVTRRKRRLGRACPRPFGVRCRTTPATTAGVRPDRSVRAFPERARRQAASVGAPPRPRPRRAVLGGERGIPCRRRRGGRLWKSMEPGASRHGASSDRQRCDASRCLRAGPGGPPPVLVGPEFLSCERWSDRGSAWSRRCTDRGCGSRVRTGRSARCQRDGGRHRDAVAPCGAGPARSRPGSARSVGPGRRR